MKQHSCIYGTQYAEKYRRYGSEKNLLGLIYDDRILYVLNRTLLKRNGKISSSII
jgi:hypothetical protein